MAGERRPNRSVTPVAMQTGVQSTLMEREDAPVIPPHPPLRGEGHWIPVCMATGMTPCVG